MARLWQPVLVWPLDGMGTAGLAYNALRGVLSPLPGKVTLHTGGSSQAKESIISQIQGQTDA